jgi:hypothetical protein
MLCLNIVTFLCAIHGDYGVNVKIAMDPMWKA